MGTTWQGRNLPPTQLKGLIKPCSSFHCERKKTLKILSLQFSGFRRKYPRKGCQCSGQRKWTILSHHLTLSSSSLSMCIVSWFSSPLSKEIQPVHPKGGQSWVFIGRTDAEAETPILWPPDVKSWLTGKDPDAGRGWGQEEKGTTEDEMAGWHHHESE